MITVTAALIKRDNAILIAQRKAGKSLGGHWEFPGGKLEIGETSEECLAREIKEELGVTASVLSRFAESIYEYENGVVRLLAFVTKVESYSIQKSADHERIEWVTPEKLLSYRLAPADVAIAEEVVMRFHEL